MTSRDLFAYLIVLIALSSLSACREEVDSEPEVAMALPSYDEIRHHDNGTIAWLKGEDLSRELALDADFAKAAGDQDFGAMAARFLDHYRGALALGHPALMFVEAQVQADDIGFHQVRFSQKLQDIPVLDTEIIVHFDNKQRLYLVSGRYLSLGEDFSLTPGFTATKAQQHLRQGKGLEDISQGELVVFAPSNQAPRLAYRFIVSPDTLNAGEFILDANDLSLLRQTPTVYSAR